jgi:hypothetical protein
MSTNFQRVTPEQLRKIARCSRCGRRWRNRQPDWNITFKDGVAVGFLCPTCQTPQENAEAEVNQATLDYGRDALGRVTGRPKGATR